MVLFFNINFLCIRSMHSCMRVLQEDVDTILSVSVPTDIQKQHDPDSREGHHAGRGETVECYRKST